MNELLQALRAIIKPIIREAVAEMLEQPKSPDRAVRIIVSVYGRSAKLLLLNGDEQLRSQTVEHGDSIDVLYAAVHDWVACSPDLIDLVQVRGGDDGGDAALAILMQRVHALRAISPRIEIACIPPVRRPARESRVDKVQP